MIQFSIRGLPTYGTYRVEKAWTSVLAAVSKTASMADAAKVGAVVIERIIFGKHVFWVSFCQLQAMYRLRYRLTAERDVLLTLGLRQRGCPEGRGVLITLGATTAREGDAVFRMSCLTA